VTTATITPTLRAVSAPSADFETELTRLGQRGQTDLARVEPAVRAILDAVRTGGDEALARYVKEFEHRETTGLIRDYGGQAALESLTPDARTSLTQAAERIAEFHERQMAAVQSFEYEKDGVRLGTRVQPVERVGVYAPGGKASYPSSVLMSAVIARVAGVREVILATPDANVHVRAAAHLAGVSAILDAGGAQAIAALAHGTKSVPKCDKIVGPGNIYVAAAKRLVFGEVAIDSIAGPSEILVVADGSARPEHIAADLLSQAEHDEAAYSLLALSAPELLDDIRDALTRQLADLPRAAIARASLEANSMAFCVKSRAELAEVANRLAVEHVAVHTERARELADAIRHAGALFIGPVTPEAAGDYFAGPSHVLPTGGAARFSSPLGVYDFVSRSSTIEYSAAALAEHAAQIATFARLEGLDAHARAVEIRTSPSKKSR
jgi:histidinol dehydrogenase